MKLPVLKGPLLYYTVTVSLLASVHLVDRSWYPVDRNIRPFESKNVTVALQPAPIPEPMSKFLMSFSETAVDETATQLVPKAKGERKELGDFFITLLALYKSGNGHKAILEVTEKASGNTQLKHLGVGDSVQEIHVESVSGTSCTLRFMDTQLNFRLFTPDRATGASVE
jgi:hypothetical protein